MALFIARVELRGNPTWNDYERLHIAMRAKGFSQTIDGGKGVFKLPHATYSTNAFANADGAALEAKNAADSIWANCAVIVSGSNWQAYGLTS